MDNKPYGDKNEALDRACAQIPALLNDADLVNFDVYEKIVIELTEYDEDVRKIASAAETAGTQ